MDLMNISSKKLLILTILIQKSSKITSMFFACSGRLAAKLEKKVLSKSTRTTVRILRR